MAATTERTSSQDLRRGDRHRRCHVRDRRARPAHPGPGLAARALLGRRDRRRGGRLGRGRAGVDPGSPHRVAETSVYVGEGFRGRGVGKALVHRQVTDADAAGLWSLQTSIFPENRVGIAVHQSAGYRTLGVRERIGRHHGRWCDTVLLERHRADDAEPHGPGHVEGP